MLSGGVSCTGQAQASRCSSSRSPPTRQLTRVVVSQKSRRCRIRKLPNQRRKPINNGRRSRTRLSASCGSKRRHRSNNVKRRRRRRRKRPKRRSEEIARGKKKRIKWQRQLLRHPHRKKKGSRGPPGYPATWCPRWLIQEERQEQRQVTRGPTYRWIMTVAGPYRKYNHRHKLCDCAGVVRA